jgi:hypothetical protein
LLNSLSKLLGKKKDLQDLELTVRPQWENERGGGFLWQWEYLTVA